MQSKQIIWWIYRRWDNWKKWIPEESLFDSLIRHVKCLELLRDWYKVDELKLNWLIICVVSRWNIHHLSYIIEEEWEWERDIERVKREWELSTKDIVWELNAIRFNAEAIKLQYLTDEIIKE